MNGMVYPKIKQIIVYKKSLSIQISQSESLSIFYRIFVSPSFSLLRNFRSDVILCSSSCSFEVTLTDAKGGVKYLFNRLYFKLNIMDTAHQIFTAHMSCNRIVIALLEEHFRVSLSFLNKSNS